MLDDHWAAFQVAVFLLACGALGAIGGLIFGMLRKDGGSDATGSVH